MVDKGVFVLFFLAGMFLLSLSFASAWVNSTTIIINATNGASGSDWFQAGSNQSINLTFVPVMFNDSTNLTQVNFSCSNFTFWNNGSGTEVSINHTGWLCTRWNATHVNCSGSTSAGTALNITLNATLNSTTYAYEVNHTINVTMLSNATDAVNSSLFYIELDGVAPTIKMPAYTNATNRKNTDQLTLNISVSDSGSNSSQCWVSINGTNQTFAVDGAGWCNFTVGNLTGMGDGNATIIIWANDSVNNMNVTHNTSVMYVVQVDTTAPSLSYTCSPSEVSQGSTTTCTCSGTDAVSGVNTSNYSYTASPSTSDTGAYTLTCTGNDNAGNDASAQVTYNVIGTSAVGSASGGGSSTFFWTAGTHTISEESFESGVDIELKSKKRAAVKVDSQNHYVGIIEMTATTATINVSSDPMQVILSIGQDAKFDVNDDGYYDIYVKLNSITDGDANLTLKEINELIPEEQEGPIETEGEITSTGKEASEGEPAEKNLNWLWWVLGGVLVVIIGGGIIAKRRE
jgi:hypothetical protein